MLIELDKSKFNRCLKLLSTNDMVNEVHAIIDGTNPGRIFVDDEVVPRSGLVWFGNLDGFCFIGDAENEGFKNKINPFLDEVIAVEAIKLGLSWFEGLGINKKWEIALNDIFEKRNPGKGKQFVYALDKKRYNYEKEPSIEKGFRVEEMTKELLLNNHLTNANHIAKKVLEFWDTLEQFELKGIGYCIIHNNTIVSHCFSAFKTNIYQAVAIETEEEYRGKALAKKTAHLFVQECFRRLYVPYWDCTDENLPSKAIANDLGFLPLYEYTVYEFPFRRGE